MSRKVSESTKKCVAGKQYYKCANKPGEHLNGLEGYMCPLWKCQDICIRGSFDESGYEIDHIVEHSVSGDDRECNLQALCKNCHIVKTKRFMRGDNDKYNCYNRNDVNDNDDNDNDDNDNDDNDNDNDDNDNDDNDNDDNDDDDDDDDDNDDNDSNADIKCKCGMTFANKQNLTRHMRSGSCKKSKNCRTFKCTNPNCKSEFSRVDSLKRHIKKCKYNLHMCNEETNDDNDNKKTYKQRTNRLESSVIKNLIDTLDSEGNLYESVLKAVNVNSKSPGHFKGTKNKKNSPKNFRKTKKYNYDLCEEI